MPFGSSWEFSYLSRVDIKDINSHLSRINSKSGVILRMDSRIDSGILEMIYFYFLYLEICTQVIPAIFIH